MRSFMTLGFVLVAVLFGATPLVQAGIFKSDNTVSVSDAVNDDFFGAGNNLHITAPIAGELFVAGNDVEITRAPARSIFVAGQSLTVEQGAGYNIYGAGNDILIKGMVEHDLYLAGNTITLDPSATVKGSVWVSGNQIKLNGTINGDVHFGGTGVESNAAIGGNLDGEATGIIFTGGSVGKDFTYRANQDAQGLDKVAIAGKKDRSDPKFNRTSFEAKRKNWVYRVLTMLVIGAALLLLVPKKVHEVVAKAQNDWAHNLLVGGLSLIVAPVGAVLLMITIIGLPVGIIVLLLWGIVLYIASVTGLILIGVQITKQISGLAQNWWWALTLGVIVVALLQLMPVIGWVVGLAVFVGATLPVLGATVSWWKERLG